MANSHLTRDQRRAIYAYEVVAKVPKKDQSEYKTVVNDLGVNVLRNGLSSAIAALERAGDRGTLLLSQLSNAGISGLEGVNDKELPDRIRKLGVDEYIFATRETLRLSAWLKRASQATFGDT